MPRSIQHHQLEALCLSPLSPLVPAATVSFSPLEIPGMSIEGLCTWIKQNNLEQCLDVIETVVYRTPNTSEMEKTLLEEVKLELQVLGGVLQHIQNLQRFKSSCLFMSSWRTGSLDATTMDLSGSLHLIQNKLSLLRLLQFQFLLPKQEQTMHTAKESHNSGIYYI